MKWEMNLKGGRWKRRGWQRWDIRGWKVEDRRKGDGREDSLNFEREIEKLKRISKRKLNDGTRWEMGD